MPVPASAPSPMWSPASIELAVRSRWSARLTALTGLATARVTERVTPSCIASPWRSSDVGVSSSTVTAAISADR